MSYDFYAVRGQENTMCFPADYELIVHDGNLSRGNDAKNTAKREIIRNDYFQSIHRDFLLHSSGRTVPTATSLGMIFRWQLSSPFFSRGITQFCAIDNPISRDRLSNCPVLYASGAKGMLRAAFASGHPTKDESENYLFGNDRGDPDGLAGALVVGDVFFKRRTRNEVFSPHFRKTRTVDKPIFFEMVPKGTKVEWSVLFFDFKLEPEKVMQLLPGVVRAVSDLITVWGMSAKRSSGYGIGKDLTVEFFPGKRLPLPEALNKGESIPVDTVCKLLEGK